jgi:hypothetical protein
LYFIINAYAAPADPSIVTGGDTAVQGVEALHHGKGSESLEVTPIERFASDLLDATKALSPRCKHCIDVPGQISGEPDCRAESVSPPPLPPMAPFENKWVETPVGERAPSHVDVLPPGQHTHTDAVTSLLGRDPSNYVEESVSPTPTRSSSIFRAMGVSKESLPMSAKGSSKVHPGPPV